jgi:hypothetical protein
MVVVLLRAAQRGSAGSGAFPSSLRSTIARRSKRIEDLVEQLLIHIRKGCQFFSAQPRDIVNDLHARAFQDVVCMNAEFQLLYEDVCWFGHGSKNTMARAVGSGPASVRSAAQLGERGTDDSDACVDDDPAIDRLAELEVRALPAEASISVWGPTGSRQVSAIRRSSSVSCATQARPASWPLTSSAKNTRMQRPSDVQDANECGASRNRLGPRHRTVTASP